MSTESAEITETPVPDKPLTPRSSRRRLILGGAVAAVIVLYGGAAWALSDRVPRGTTVAGVDIGGLSRDAATKRLQSAATARQGTPLPVVVNGRNATLDLAAAGLQLDARATLDELVGFSVNPITLGKHLTGGGEQSALPKPDTDKLKTALTAVAAAVAAPAADASIAFVNGEPVLTAAVTGTELQPGDAARVVQNSWLAGARPLSLPAVVKQPEITQQEAQDALTKVAEPAVSAPLIVKIGERSVSVPVAQLAPTLKLAPKDGRLALAVDGPKLLAVVLKADPEIGAAAKDAQIVLKKGKPAVIPAVSGVTVDPDALAAVVVPALTDRARTAVVKTVTKEPKLTTEDAVKLGVKEKISTFSTILTDNAQRTDNLRIAARTVNGTLVLPGETFSLNAVLGQRTAEKGYHQAPAISGGRLVNDYGGGVSQMATTIFNNVFFSGLEDVYHKPHSFYISRYPEGREATVNFPSVDLKWRNDSETAVLIKANVTSTVNVTFYGTKTWDITASRSGRSNFRTPKTVYDDQPGCVPQGANGGFDVSVGRTFRKPGSSTVVKKETFNAVYNAEDQIICGPKPDADPKK